MSYIVTIDGAASASDHSSAVLEAARRVLRRNGLHSDAIVVRNLPAADLLHARMDSMDLEAAQCLVAQAQGIVIATPLHETTYSGLLKTFLDTLSQGALQDKTILPLTTGGSPLSLLSGAYPLRSVLTSLGAISILRPVSIETAAIRFEHGGVVHLEESADTRLRDSLAALTRAVHPIAPAFIDRQDPLGLLASARSRR